MSPITHFFAGWVAFERWQLGRRDKALVVLAGVLPDLDGLGLLVDAANRALGRPETDWYQTYHRMYGHGLPAAVVLAALAAVLAHRRLRVATFAFLSVHLHLLCDLIGSRGETVDDLWGIRYFAPFDPRPALTWSGQWPLVGWQNTMITVLLLVVTMIRAARVGYSPVALFSRAADRHVVTTLRGWLHRLPAPFRPRD